MSNEIEAAVNTKAEALKEWQRPLLVSLLFCDSCNLKEDGKADVIGVFDRIYVHPDTRVTPLFTLFVRTAETTGEMIRVICRAPDGGIPTLVDFMVAPASEFSPNLPSNVQGIVTMNPFRVYSEGVYWFDVSFKGQSLGGAALVIEFRETEDKQGGTDTYI